LLLKFQNPKPTLKSVFMPQSTTMESILNYRHIASV
jgi:hypothetical protein